MKKKLILFLIILAVIFNVTSCDELSGLIDPFSSDSSTETETEEEEITTAPVLDLPKFLDPMTGEPADRDLGKARPVAVVVKNDRAASPQYGLSKASVLYEAIVEGGLTRFLAVYSDVSLVDKVGPVIDARACFYDFAANHNAVFVQAGTTKYGNTTQVSRGITALDAIVGDMSPGFYRDTLLSQARGYENSILTDSNGLKSRALQYGISVTSESRVSPYTVMDYLQTRDMSSGVYCTYLSIPFSTNMTVDYAYSTLTNKYTRSQYGAPHTDALTGNALSFTNIIILIADYVTVDQTTGEMYIMNTGSGSGYYIYGGSCLMIKWQRENGEKPINLFETDGLTPLQISAGNTYIAVVSPRLSGKIEFERTDKK